MPNLFFGKSTYLVLVQRATEGLFPVHEIIAVIDSRIMERNTERAQAMF